MCLCSHDNSIKRRAAQPDEPPVAQNDADARALDQYAIDSSSVALRRSENQNPFEAAAAAIEFQNKYVYITRRAAHFTTCAAAAAASAANKHAPLEKFHSIIKADAASGRRRLPRIGSLLQLLLDGRQCNTNRADCRGRLAGLVCAIPSGRCVVFSASLPMQISGRVKWSKV